MGKTWITPLQNLAKSLLYEEERECVLCGAPGVSICLKCEQDYLKPELVRCNRCGKLLPGQGPLCQDCLLGKGPKHLTLVTAWGHYDGALKSFIQDVKFRSQPKRLMKIGGLLAGWAIRHLPPVDGIVAVPMHVERLLERGFNQAEVIASLLHWELGIPLLRGIARTSPTTPQVGLSRSDRLHNLDGAFTVTDENELRGKEIWLVDDVTTTGTTLDSAACVLVDNGVQHVYGLCLAAGMEKKGCAL